MFMYNFIYIHTYIYKTNFIFYINITRVAMNLLEDYRVLGVIKAGRKCWCGIATIASATLITEIVQHVRI